MKGHYQCSNCDADFRIKFDLDESFYEVSFCPFCGGDITEDEDDTEEDE